MFSFYDEDLRFVDEAFGFLFFLLKEKMEGDVCFVEKVCFRLGDGFGVRCCCCVSFYFLCVFRGS